ncbi:MAG: hypothetical protein B7X04_00685 [Parcubacteria group bacterium 21-54-25]|nr:MAG: hypothetical protein B7X04_00685 [Parcubacteria group bacterium 21-54-25]HQU07974.1 hypothetical protein [Candidatus Paceibacterota bacterium]
MKIINQTATDMTITHPSVVRSVVGVIFLVLSAVLFIVSIAGSSDALFFSHTAYLLFIVGVFALFVNTDIVIDIDKKTGHIHHKRKKLVGSKTETHDLHNVSHVEVRHTQRHAAGTPLISESFLIFSDGSEVRIDRGRMTTHIAIGDSATNEKEKASIASRVARFLGIPVEDRIRSEQDQKLM